MLIQFAYCIWFYSYGAGLYDPGQSAATAAAIAIDDKSNVQQVSYEKLQKQLLDQHQILSQ